MQAKTRVQVMEVQQVKGDSLACSWTLLFTFLATRKCFSRPKYVEGQLGPVPGKSMHEVHSLCMAEVLQQVHAQQHPTRLGAAV